MRAIAIACAAALIWVTGASASELIYQPINPSFGGNPFNSDHLLATADIQNKYEDDDEDRAGLPQLSPSEQFARTIQSRLLSRVSLEIADRIFGEDAQDSGEFRFADTVITFNRQDGIIHLVLFDEATGSETVIDIPDTGF
jgi:curli production assembly/transport component CsgF